MKTVLEQLMEIQDQVDSLKMHWVNTESFKAEPDPVCDGYSGCGCGCDEPEIETPQSAITTEGTTIITFTKDELITFATHLVERTLDKCKEAVTDTSLNADNLVDLSMGYGYQIDVELDTDSIVRSIHDEIDGVVDTDSDSVNDEITDILNDMDIDYIS
jgi:hypothetical protein